MKLLIVDDEKITRDGLISSISWEDLGIHSIAQADDGIHALEIAGEFHPDIVLSDIRMPRLNGIDMAYKLQKMNPNLSLIFMSGYSDKEYLKAAIRLKAVTYVEKPIDPEEISSAIKDACKEVEQLQKSADSAALSISYSRSRLAESLSNSPRASQPFPHAEDLDFSFPLEDNTPFFSLIIKFWSPPADQYDNAGQLSSRLTASLENQKLQEIHFIKQERLFICHIWGFREFSNSRKELLGADLIRILNEYGLKYHILIGKNVSGARNIFNSYNSAVIEMQNSFFYPENTCWIYQHHDNYAPFPDLSELQIHSRFYDSLLKKEQDLTISVVENLFQQLLTQKNVLPNQIKELYYSLFQDIRKAYTALQIEFSGKDNFWGIISACESIFQLQELLLDRINTFFSDSESRVEENSTIYLIKDFIAKHYQDESLSIKDISAHVFLSSSYVCTIFKNETGMTLNQYLTDYRIERAKKLLADPRNKISDISAAVGYSDGNYFGKTFKKMVGVSPSEYREQENL